MRKQEEQNNKLRDWIRELPKEKPSVNFVNNVMSAVSTEVGVQKAAPVFGRRFIWALFAACVCFGFGLYFIEIPQLEIGWEFSLPTYSLEDKEVLSFTAISCGIGLLFLVQLSWVKHWYQKQFLD